MSLPNDAGVDSRVRPVESVDELLDLLAAGDGAFDSLTGDGDPVDLLAHALQCGHELTLRYPDDEALQVAGLVHDIGHLLVPGDDAGHGIAAAAAIRGLLGTRVAELAENHVAAKRYLVANDAGYADLLSSSSVRTLGNQGGTMALIELDDCAKRPYWTDSLELRRADDAAKTPGRAVPGLPAWKAVLTRVAAKRTAE